MVIAGTVGAEVVGMRVKAGSTNGVFVIVGDGVIVGAAVTVGLGGIGVKVGGGVLVEVAGGVAEASTVGVGLPAHRIGVPNVGWGFSSSMAKLQPARIRTRNKPHRTFFTLPTPKRTIYAPQKQLPAFSDQRSALPHP